MLVLQGLLPALACAGADRIVSDSAVIPASCKCESGFARFRCNIAGLQTSPLFWGAARSGVISRSWRKLLKLLERLTR